MAMDQSGKDAIKWGTSMAGEMATGITAAVSAGTSAAASATSAFAGPFALVVIFVTFVAQNLTSIYKSRKMADFQIKKTEKDIYAMFESNMGKEEAVRSAAIDYADQELQEQVAANEKKALIFAVLVIIISVIIGFIIIKKKII